MSLQSRIVCTLLGAAALSFGVANAGDTHSGRAGAVQTDAQTATQTGVIVVNRTVSYADLDLSKQKDARVLYSRLKAASEQVCSAGFPPQNLNMKRLEGDCFEAALGGAVSKVNHPAILALHDSSRPTRIAQGAKADGQRT